MEVSRSGLWARDMSQFPPCNPVTLSISHFCQKRYPMPLPSIDKWYPFHTPSLELCKYELYH